MEYKNRDREKAKEKIRYGRITEEKLFCTLIMPTISSLMDSIHTEEQKK